MGWELTAWIATKNGRAALALALTGMIREGEVSRARAEEIATMVMRTNAGKLYKLGLEVSHDRPMPVADVRTYLASLPVDARKATQEHSRGRPTRGGSRRSRGASSYGMYPGSSSMDGRRSGTPPGKTTSACAPIGAA